MIQPVTHAAIRELREHDMDIGAMDQNIANATPVFEITHVRSGTIASIASQQWSTRFSVPVDGQVLEGATGSDGYTDETMKAQWKDVHVQWTIDPSYTPERIAEINSMTVGQVIARSAEWAAPGTYTSYATFDVTLSFQGKTVGPYTASFFFGRDQQGREIVAPEDAIGAGQVLWDVLRLDFYPRELFSSKLRTQPALTRWLHDNLSLATSRCSRVRSDLCCVGEKCLLPQTLIAKDLSLRVER